jgi:hypothetical protein
MKNSAPAFQAYGNELLGLFVGLSLESQGAAWRLFLIAWTQAPDQSSLMDDDMMLARMLGIRIEEWKVLRAEIQHPAKPIFLERKGLLISSYLQREFQKQRKFRKLQSEKGKRSAEHRLIRGSTAVHPMHQPEGNSSSSSSISVSSSIEERKIKDVPPAVDLELKEVQHERGRASVGWLAQEWNRVPGVVPANGSLTGSVLKTIQARLREHPNQEFWKRLFDSEVAPSEFLCGRKTDWAASLDWICGPKNLSKVLSGRYRNVGTQLRQGENSAVGRALSRMAKGGSQ